MTTKNPFLDAPWMPRYDAMTPELCVAALEATVPAAERAFKAAARKPEISWEGLMVRPMLALRPAFEVWGMLCHLTSVVNSEAWRAVEAAWLPRLVALGQLAAQSRAIYEGLGALLAGDALEPWQRHVAERTAQEMRLSGVGLAGAGRRAFNAAQRTLSRLSLAFSNHVLDAERETRVEVAPGEEAGIPADLLPGKGPWRLGIDFATYDAVMRHAQCPAVRERLWRARAGRAASGKGDNAPLIARILALRQRIAEILGLPDYAHLSTAQKMAGAPRAVEALLAPMAEVGRPAAKAEDAELLAFARANGHKGRLEPWDRPFWAERQSQERFGYDEETLRAYFPMERVIEGLFALIEELFGVRAERVRGPLHAWHRDVRFYRLLGAGGEPLAGLYLDPYARPGSKNGGAWMNELRGRDFETRRQLPIAVVCCNQKPPRGKAPATMSFYEVVTLFHEMGHALQATLTEVDSPLCSGITNVEWDAVEIASQFLEQFPYEPALLRRLSCHVETDKPLPKALAERVVAKRTYRAGNALVRQLLFAETDLALHARAHARRGEPAEALLRRVAKRLLPAPLHPDDHFLDAFTHIFAGGYAAGYYSYKWSETLSADIYGLFAHATAAKRRALGRRYRATLLALGGSKPAAEVFRALVGRDPDPAALLRLEGLLPDEA